MTPEPDRPDDVTYCEGCGAPLLQRTDDDGRVWWKCTGEHGWLRVPFADADFHEDGWGERRQQELVMVQACWDRSDRATTKFNEFMEMDQFVTLGAGQAVLIAIGALEEDELRHAVRGDSFQIDRIAAKLGWSIGRTLDGLSSLRERELAAVVDV